MLGSELEDNYYNIHRVENVIITVIHTELKKSSYNTTTVDN